MDIYENEKLEFTFFVAGHLQHEHPMIWDTKLDELGKKLHSAKTWAARARSEFGNANGLIPKASNAERSADGVYFQRARAAGLLKSAIEQLQEAKDALGEHLKTINDRFGPGQISEDNRCRVQIAVVEAVRLMQASEEELSKCQERLSRDVSETQNSVDKHFDQAVNYLAEKGFCAAQSGGAKGVDRLRREASPTPTRRTLYDAQYVIEVRRENVTEVLPHLQKVVSRLAVSEVICDYVERSIYHLPDARKNAITVLLSKSRDYQTQAQARIALCRKGFEKIEEALLRAEDNLLFADAHKPAGGESLPPEQEERFESYCRQMNAAIDEACYLVGDVIKWDQGHFIVSFNLAKLAAENAILAAELASEHKQTPDHPVVLPAEVKAVLKALTDKVRR